VFGQHVIFTTQSFTRANSCAIFHIPGKRSRFHDIKTITPRHYQPIITTATLQVHPFQKRSELVTVLTSITSPTGQFDPTSTRSPCPGQPHQPQSIPQLLQQPRYVRCATGRLPKPAINVAAAGTVVRFAKRMTGQFTRSYARASPPSATRTGQGLT
jgi:hypothetical protein